MITPQAALDHFAFAQFTQPEACYAPDAVKNGTAARGDELQGKANIFTTDGRSEKWSVNDSKQL
ncbi:MAG: hypothetical protein IPI81_11740 [Flavobacteriales bacterium]|nr:hypothetical protein [Flavobacteriales bacterium]